MIMRRTRDAVKPIRFVAFVLLLGMGGLMIAACSGDAWRKGGGAPDPYKDECRSESCAM